MCGEQTIYHQETAQTNGSSPRVRGTDHLSPRDSPNQRFIPACAGNGSPGPRRCHRRSVHSRVCGEQDIAQICTGQFCGSSPRVRGTEHLAVGRRGWWRFIPACAGNRQCTQFRWSRESVHPRVCGEQITILPLYDATEGSSPRVRGTVSTFPPRHARDRFIPACAGNRLEWLRDPYALPVHPRVCGEQSLIGFAQLGNDGSSPRVRGTG